MLLTFKTIDNVIFKIDVDPAEKVKSLKRRIQNDRGTEYVAEGMKLLFAGKILDDEKTISDYAIGDKGFIVIMVPRPKTPGKESGKKARSNPTQIPGISTIHENAPLSFDAQFSSTNPTNPTIPVSNPQWQGHGSLPQSGQSSDDEASAGSHGKLFESQDSYESALPAHNSKRHSLRSSVSTEGSTSTESSRRVATMLQDDTLSPHVRTPSSTHSNVPPLKSHATPEADVLTSPLESLDEQSKLSEVSNWLDKLVVGEPASVVEHPSNADENVQKIVDMGFKREQAEAALNASFNSIEAAMEYLVTGIIPAAQPQLGAPSFALIPPTVQRSHSTARSMRNDVADDPLEFLQTDEEFQLLRITVQKDPDLLPSALESFRSKRSDLQPVFEAFEDRLVELLTEPADDPQHRLPGTVAMDTGRTPVNDLPTPASSKTPRKPPADPLHLHMEPHQSHEQFDPQRSLSVGLNQLRDPLPVFDDSTSSSLFPRYGEQRIPPIGEETSGCKTPHEEDVRDEEEDKETEDLIRELLLQDQEEEEKLEAERRAAAAESISWSEVEPFGSGVAGGVGSTSGDVGGWGGRGGGGRTLEERGYVRVTVEEKQAIDRLKALGFTEERVVQMYLACEKNEEMAANILLDKD